MELKEIKDNSIKVARSTTLNPPTASQPSENRLRSSMRRLSPFHSRSQTSTTQKESSSVHSSDALDSDEISKITDDIQNNRTHGNAQKQRHRSHRNRKSSRKKQNVTPGERLRAVVNAIRFIGNTKRSSTSRKPPPPPVTTEIHIRKATPNNFTDNEMSMMSASPKSQIIGQEADGIIAQQADGTIAKEVNGVIAQEVDGVISSDTIHTSPEKNTSTTITASVENLLFSPVHQPKPLQLL